MEPMRSDAFIHFYVAVDESTSGWEFYCLFLNPPTLRVFSGLTGANFVTFTIIHLTLLKNYCLSSLENK